MIRFEPKTCVDLDVALRKEWLETNGIGGFASSNRHRVEHTPLSPRLLVATTKPLVGRFVLLSKLKETLFVDEQSFELFGQSLSRRGTSTGLTIASAVSA